MLSIGNTPKDSSKPVSSAHIFADLLVYFFSDKDRPADWRLLLTSVLLVSGFALGIGVLFGLPMTLIAILAAKSDPGHLFSLERFGVNGVQFSVVFVVIGYLSIYFLSTVFTYLSRRMLVSDNVHYTKKITNSVSEQFDHAVKHNLYIPDMPLDRALFNRLTISGSRTLPRIHMTLLSGIMPAVFGMLSLATLLFIDLGLGLAVFAIILVSLPLVLRFADRFTSINTEHSADARMFNDKFRDTAGEAIFTSEIERELQQLDAISPKGAEESFSELAEHRDRFFRSFEEQQIIQDRMRFIIGVATFIMLAGAFAYYLYAPWSNVSVGAIFALVLGLRYFIVALNGLSSSFVSLTSGHNDLMEIIKFRRGYERAVQHGQETAVRDEIEFYDLATACRETLRPAAFDMIEVVTDAPLSYENAFQAYGKLTGVEAPVFLENVAALGFPGRNYRRAADLDKWIEENHDAVANTLGLAPSEEKRTAAQLKKAFEEEYFARRKLKLPPPLWNMMSEWAYHQNTPHADKMTILLNGDVFARLPHLTRKMILERHRSCAIFVIYRTPPRQFVSQDEARFFVVHEECALAIAKGAPADSWRKEIQTAAQ